MGLFDNLFKSTTEDEKSVKINWIDLTNQTELNELISLSYTKYILIFKHSTRCGISRSVLNQFEKTTDSNQENVAFYYLDLLKNRALSNEIASLFNVYHQSPQLLIIKEGKAISHYSHYDIISSFNLEDYI